MLETMTDRQAQWLQDEGPEHDFVLGSCGRLVRNLADFPFPCRCTDAEKSAVESRIRRALDSVGLTAHGVYAPYDEMGGRETGILSERRLVDVDFLDGQGTRGVYVSDDQNTSIVVNGDDHLCIQVLAPGLQLKEVWQKLNVLDDTLAAALDFAFDCDWGYLTSSPRRAGTGLTGKAFVHLPVLARENKVGAFVPPEKARYTIAPFYSDAGEIGDLFEVSSLTTLNSPEEEVMFHLRHFVEKLIAAEREAREELLASARHELEDRVGRAIGVARGARLLGFDEAADLLSSIRLGLQTGLLDGYATETINELQIAARSGHIEMRLGHACDDSTLNMERANMFRARFS